MTVREFCKNKTKATELCIIRDRGYIVSAVWIDYEDIFRLPESIKNKEVKNLCHGTIDVYGMKNVPCVYIDC